MDRYVLVVSVCQNDDGLTDNSNCESNELLCYLKILACVNDKLKLAHS